MYRFTNIISKERCLLASQSDIRCRIFLHEILHELSQVLGSFHRHSVVHGDSDSRVESVAPDLDDSRFFSLRNEGLFKLFISVLNSENYIDSRSVVVIADLGLIVSIRRVDEGPKDFRSLVS